MTVILYLQYDDKRSYFQASMSVSLASAIVENMCYLNVSIDIANNSLITLLEVPVVGADWGKL